MASVRSLSLRLSSTLSHHYHQQQYSKCIPLKRHRHRHRHLSPMCGISVSHPDNWRQSRRFISFSFLLLQFSSTSSPPSASAAGIFDKYLKKKKLEPLETYVPAVILTQMQIKDIEKSLESDQPQFATFRSILRSGPAASFRSNVRAVAQYVSDAGKGKNAFDNVDRCLRAVDELDSLLLRASRKDGDTSTKLMKEKIGIAMDALDSLLQALPADVLDKGKTIAEAYSAPESNVVPEELDQEFKELKSVL